jgi:hypothetical protein
MEGKKRITRMATKIARLVALGLLFVGLYEGFVILEEDTRPRPPAALDHNSLHSSGKYHGEENVAALGHWLTIVFQPQERARGKYLIQWHIFPLFQIKGTPLHLCFQKSALGLRNHCH